MSKEELAQTGMNRSSVLMLVREEDMGIDTGKMVDVVAGDFASFLLTDSIFSVQ